MLAHEAYNFDVAERMLWRARIAEWFSDADIENGSAWDG